MPDPLVDVRDWLSPYERFWRGRLRNLRDLLDTEGPDTVDPDVR